MTASTHAEHTACRMCGGDLEEFVDFGRQPVSNSFPRPEQVGAQRFYRLAMGFCTRCTMVQQIEEVPRTQMFHDGYPYRSSSSSSMVKHFRQVASDVVLARLIGDDPFVVEIGSNDGILLTAVHEAGVRHLGVDPSGQVCRVAVDQGVRILNDFFDERSAATVRAEHGPADVIFSSNTTSHISYIDSVLRGVDTLLAEDGVLVLEDRYVGDIVGRVILDQIYDEHFYLLGVRSTRAMVARFGLELVDVDHLPVHGGSIRYTIARPGRRPVSPRVAEMLAQEAEAGLADIATYRRFAERARRTVRELTTLLGELRARGARVVGYGATAKSATVLNFGGIGTGLIPFVCDSIPEKQGRVTPGSHLPVVAPSAFADPYPDYAVLFAWSHADEILAKERGFRESGGRWILYVPDVHIV